MRAMPIAQTLANISPGSDCDASLRARHVLRCGGSAWSRAAAVGFARSVGREAATRVFRNGGEARSSVEATQSPGSRRFVQAMRTPFSIWFPASLR